MNVPPDAGAVLLPLARAAIADRLGRPVGDVLEPDWLSAPGASFVTLTINGRLRGCIGSLSAGRALGSDVAGNARRAAFRDPRFPRLDADEYDRMTVEVSVLTPSEPMTFTDRADAVAQLRPGVDGVALTAGKHRATFLPQVWEQLPDPDRFIDALLRKAGLDRWPDQLELARYRVRSWQECPADANPQPGPPTGEARC